MTAIKGLAAALLVTASASALADDVVYKYRRADGAIVYSSTPMDGLKLIGRFQLVPAPPAPPAASPLSREAGDADEIARRRLMALDAADAQIRAAEQALKNAQDRQQAGVEPLPGERVGNANGTSRLRGDYFRRQGALAHAVEAAQANLAQAIAARNQLRD